MALDPGSVSVDPTTGDVSGSGYALALYDLEADAAPSSPIDGEDLRGALDARVVAIAEHNATRSTWPEGWADGESLRPLTRANLLERRQKLATKCNALAAAHVALVQSATVTTVVPSTPGTFVGTVT